MSLESFKKTNVDAFRFPSKSQNLAGRRRLHSNLFGFYAAFVEGHRIYLLIRVSWVDDLFVGI